MRGPVDPWRRVGARRQEAGGFADYQALVSGPGGQQFASAGAEIASQMAAEGWPQSRIDLAQGRFADVVGQLSSMGVQIDDPIGDAKQFVLTGQTIAGAVSTVQGLVTAAQSGSTVEVAQAFTGIMIGTMVAAGAVTAGVGALIVAGVGAVGSVLASFWSTNPGVKICESSGVVATSQPDLVAGCLAGFAGAAGVARHPPGDPNWRTFPAKTKLDDAAWYLPCGGGGCGEFSWGGLTWSNKLTANPAGPMRPIDYAFGAFGSVEPYLTSPVGPPGFTDGWVAAWKSNAEYALNGLKPQDDAMVLAHYVRMWNLSHAPSPIVPLSALAPQYSYLSDLTEAALTYVQESTDRYGSGDLAINAGPMLAPPRPVVRLTIGHAAPQRVVQFRLPARDAATAAAPKSSAAGSALAVGALAFGAAMLWKPALLKKLGIRL